MGDWNAVVEEGQDGRRVGKCGLGKRNNRGESLVNICNRNPVNVENTLSQQHKRRRYIWTCPRLNLDVSAINNAYRVGGGKNRPIVVKLNSYFIKEHIMANTNQLKGSKIYIENDFSKEIREKRKKLVPLLKEARFIGFKAILVNDKIKINGNIVDLEFLKDKNIEDVLSSCKNNRNTKMATDRNRSSSPHHANRRRSGSRNRKSRSVERTEQISNAINRLQQSEITNWRMDGLTGAKELISYLDKSENDVNRNPDRRNKRGEGKPSLEEVKGAREDAVRGGVPQATREGQRK
ncbi:hypothetical protein ANN_00678 [Periplaneta americana]|uniref:Uncharacterized protein n=1 Tax=Periplaneta americana TaxID=6978 RepID=A0ABQ8TVG8_PERAM|nr:hypothetical protein ANN_00678 [Periplaneta americana]